MKNDERNTKKGVETTQEILVKESHSKSAVTSLGKENTIYTRRMKGQHDNTWRKFDRAN